MLGKRAQRAIAKGMSKRKVAEVFNVSPRTIGRIAEGSHWTVREKN
jgi:transcriptional regulator with XRE-family HTH domain